MIYGTYTIGGELMHSAKGVEWGNHKYIDKVKTKIGKYRYVYNKPKKKTRGNGEVIENPYADKEYMDSKQYKKAFDADGNIIWVPSDKRVRDDVKMNEYLEDLIKEIVKELEEKKDRALARR